MSKFFYNDTLLLKELQTPDLWETNQRKTYTIEEVIYHLKQSIDSGLLEGESFIMTQELRIRIIDISPKGHEFLNDIRSDTIWKSTKNVAKKIGSTSVSALIQIASGIVSTIIKTELGY